MLRRAAWSPPDHAGDHAPSRWVATILGHSASTVPPLPGTAFSRSASDARPGHDRRPGTPAKRRRSSLPIRKPFFRAIRTHEKKRIRHRKTISGMDTNRARKGGLTRLDAWRSAVDLALYQHSSRRRAATKITEDASDGERAPGSTEFNEQRRRIDRINRQQPDVPRPNEPTAPARCPPPSPWSRRVQAVAGTSDRVDHRRAVRRGDAVGDGVTGGQERTVRPTGS